jgi:PBSX family phage terminase large subunit
MQDLVLHDGQAKVIDSDARFVAVVCGAQSGKTTLGGIWLCNEIWRLHEKGLHGDWLVAAPTAKILDQSTLPKLKGIIPSDWVIWREGRQFFELPWINPETNQPCRIFVRSTDNPDFIEGMTIMGAWIDEAGLCDSVVWVNVQARVAKNQGRVLMTTTPYASKWLKREIVDRAKRGEKEFASFTWASSMNPAFPAEEFERLKRTLPDAIFKRRHMGEWTTLEGLVYPDFSYDNHVVKPLEIPASWNRIGGMDFGHSQPTVILCIAEDPASSTFYVYREFYRKEALLKDIAGFLSMESLRMVLADPQGAQAIAELNRFYGRGEVRAAENRVEIGIERIGTLLKEGRLKFFDTCEQTISEIEEYHYPAQDQDKQDRKDRPVKKDDHAMDALKYAFSRQLSSLYPYRAERRVGIKERLARRQIPEADFWTNY